jgi:hypothetical protein
MEPLLEVRSFEAPLGQELPMRRLGRKFRLRGGADENAPVNGCVGVASAIAVLFVFGVFVDRTSAVVEPNHIGIKRKAITNQVDLNRVYHSGRHWWEPLTTFVLFPTTVQNVKMEFTSRTSEGYPLNLKAEFQYQLIPDKITELYSHYTVKYEAVYQRNVRAEMMKAMSEYDASALFKKRVEILKDMETRVDRVLRDSYARCWSVQFDDVMQPAAFEKTLLLTQLQEWYSRQKLAEQRTSAIEAGTQVLEAEFNKNISVVNSTATQKCKYIISQATAYASNYENEAQSNATLLTDKAKAEGSVVEREVGAAAELRYQEALAQGDSSVLKEKAEANMRSTKLEGLRLRYWKNEVKLSEAGLVQFQKLLGSYERLENVTFLFGFGNSYASADASLSQQPPGPSSLPSVSQVAALANAVTKRPEAEPSAEL